MKVMWDGASRVEKFHFAVARVEAVERENVEAI
jgi:hypothetical protein